MARKRVTRTLSQLPEASTVQAADHKTDRLVEILRGLALKNQQEQPKPFYSVRNVATTLRVPVSMVSRGYGELEREGILRRIRGSKTILEGVHYDRRLSVRAFVGLPASEATYITLQEYRTFFDRMKHELRLRGFAAAMVFLKRHDLKTAALSNRLKSYQVDTVIWFFPPNNAREAMARLSDLGIRVLGITEGHETINSCRYEIRRDSSIRLLLSDWKERHSIHKVTLVESREYRSPSNDTILERVLDELQIQTVVANFAHQRPEAFLRGLQKSKTGGIIFSSCALASMFCFRRPAAVTELVRNKRVAFIDGPVNMPFAKVPDAPVDLIVVNWQLVAEAIVNDLITQEAFQRPGPTIFEAEPHLRVPLNQFAQST